MGTTYYVKASGGSDANNGLTTAGAFATISKGCITAFPGDTVKCLTGTYNASVYINSSNMRNGTAASPITLQSVTPYAAMFKALAAPATGGGNDAMLEVRRDWWIIDGFEANGSAGYAGSPPVWQLGGAGQYRTGIYYSGAHGVIQNCYIHHQCQADPGGSGGSGAQIEGFYNSYIDSSSTVQYCHVHNTASAFTTNKSHGVYMTSPACRILGNLIYNQFGGCQIHGWHGFDGPTAIANNTVFNGTNVGILIGQGDGGAGSVPAPNHISIFNNIIMDITGNGVSMFHGSSSPATGTSNAVVANLTFNCTTAYNVRSTTTNGARYSAPVGLVNYIKTGGGDYHLASGSTAIDRGIPTLSGQSAPILDIDGVSRPQNSLWDLGAYEFVSGGGDVTAPTYVSGVVENATPNLLTITMNEALDAGQTPNSTAFAVSGGKTVTNAVISGSTIILTISSAYVFGDVITVTYTKPAALPYIRDGSGNATASFGPNAVTNNVGTVSVGSPGVPIAAGRDRKVIFRSR